MAYKLAEENSIGALGECVVTEYESSAPYAAVAVTRPGLLAASEGLAFGRHGTLYAADSANTEAADKVLIFGEPPVEGLQGAPPPAINSTYVERDGSNSALLAAAINPHFVSGTYRVEYGRESSYGSVSATMPLVSVTEVAETFPLEGLQPETLYHYRFVVENANKEVGYGPDETFETYAAAQSTLPDGRVYELVTPPYKNGNTLTPFAQFKFGVGEAGGEAVAYTASGAMGASTFSTQSEFVSRRTPGVGWSTATRSSAADDVRSDVHWSRHTGSFRQLQSGLSSRVCS